MTCKLELFSWWEDVKNRIWNFILNTYWITRNDDSQISDFYHCSLLDIFSNSLLQLGNLFFVLFTINDFANIWFSLKHIFLSFFSDWDSNLYCFGLTIYSTCKNISILISMMQTRTITDEQKVYTRFTWINILYFFVIFTPCRCDNVNILNFIFVLKNSTWILNTDDISHHLFSSEYSKILILIFKLLSSSKPFFLFVMSKIFPKLKVLFFISFVSPRFFTLIHLIFCSTDLLTFIVS